MEEESARQHFEKISLQMKNEFENIADIVEEKPDAVNTMELNKDMQQLLIDPQDYVQMDNDMRDVERNFTNDPALESFRLRYEVASA